MLRSFRARLLAASLLVALLAIAVTAWITNRATSDELERRIEDDVFAEQTIYEELTFYAITNGDWLEAQELVEELAAEYERRIAVAGFDGAVLADSADDRDLPDAPVGIIDPGNPLITFDPESNEVIAEVDQVNAEGKALASYLDELGIPYELVTDEFGITFPELDFTDPESNAAVEQFYLEGEFDDLEAILEDGFGKFDDEGAFAEKGFAAPALLYIEPAGTSPFSGVFTRGLVAAVVIVAAAAVLVTVLLSRRLLRPITALTGAARELRAGDLSHRVAVAENGEIGTLAEAFNSMAAALEESDRARRTMTADIAHELRTPLANIRGYLEAADEGVVAPDRELVATVHEEAMLLQRLVEDLETLSRGDAEGLRLERSGVRVDELLDRVAAAHRARAEAEGVELAIGAAPAITLEVDEGRMRQALGNLVDNALRHTPAGGRVAITAVAGARTAQIIVADTGEGIAPEHLAHVFDRFYRADPSRTRATGGSGLGMAIARQIVEAHGGTMTATSTVGEGTTVTATLPI